LSPGGRGAGGEGERSPTTLSPGPLAPLSPSGRGAGGEGVEAHPFDRHGPPPALIEAEDEQALVSVVAGAVAGARERGCASVAIVTKTAGRARELAGSLDEAGVGDVALAATPDFTYRGGTVVLPVYLAKGLEFDAAIVVDADARTYPATAFDGRLLYVALTRAMHELHVVWRGRLTTHLRS
ncbi:MAG: ATP-binding domain-containing protein, partial [Chloroflexi bacterium]|nr:ATP-binding domain-containing protein [Chloroflexota bacterium]